MRNTVNIYEAKAHLSKLISQVEKTGRPVTICRNHEPIADLVPHRRHADPLQQDPALKGARFRGDPCAPVSDEDWPEELR